MKKFKTYTLAGVVALSMSAASSSYADSVGCTSDGSTAGEVAALEEVIAALEQWISERTPADPNWVTLTGHLATVESMLDKVLARGQGSKPPYSTYACALDVSPA